MAGPNDANQGSPDIDRGTPDPMDEGAVRDYNAAIAAGASHMDALGQAIANNPSNLGQHNSDGYSGLNNDGSASNGLLDTTAHQKEVDSANAMKDTIWTTKHGSQGVDNKAYEEYMKRHPDLMADYEKNWGKGGALAQNGEAITMAEYGAMHYWEYGKKEGRSLDGKGGGPGGGGDPNPKPKPDPKPPGEGDISDPGVNTEDILGDTYDHMYNWNPISSDGQGGTQPTNPLVDPNNWLHQTVPQPIVDPGTYINPNIPGNQAQSSQQQASMPMASGGGLLDQMNQNQQGLLMDLELHNLLGG